MLIGLIFILISSLIITHWFLKCLTSRWLVINGWKKHYIIDWNVKLKILYSKADHKYLSLWKAFKEERKTHEEWI